MAIVAMLRGNGLCEPSVDGIPIMMRSDLCSQY